MKNKLLKVVSLFIFMIVIPIFTSAKTYNSSVSVAGDYMLSGDYKDSYDKYILTVPSASNNYYSNDSAKFPLGGLISLEEFKITMNGDANINKSYLYEGSSYWTLTSGGDGKRHIISSGFPVIAVSDSDGAKNVGVKVTEYVKAPTTVYGTGSFDTPWVFSPQYRITIKVQDPSKGFIKTTESSTTELEEIEFVMNSTSDQKSFFISAKGDYEYIGSTCGFVLNDIQASSDNKIIISNVARDTECYISFGDKPIKIELARDNTETAGSPQYLYLIAKNGWYSDSFGNYQIAKINTIPSKTGYTFKGYYKASSASNACSGTLVVQQNKNLVNDYSVLKTLTNNEKLYPCFTPNKYTVSFDSNGGSAPTIASKEVTFNSTYGTLASTSWLGRTFDGWYTSTTFTSGQVFDTSRVSTASNHTLYAKWILHTYSISYALNGGTLPTDRPTGASYDQVFKVGNPTRQGYTFTGWTITSGLNTSTAKYGNSTSAVTNSISSSSTLIKNQYFMNLTPNNNGSITFTANWSANTDTPYTVRHYQQNLADDNYTLVATDNLTGTTDTSVTPARKTYTGFTSPSGSTVNIDADGSRVVNYYYPRQTFVVSLSAGTGIASVTGGGTYKYGTNVTVSATMKPGYNWDKWSNGNTNRSYSFQLGAANVSLTANATAGTVGYKVNHYQQNIADDNYTLYTTDNLTGTTDTSVSPSRKSYTGFTAPAAKTVTINGNGTTVVDYYYTRNKYTVTLSKGTGISAVSGAGTYKYGASVTANATVSTGYTWSSWSNGTTSRSYTFTMGASNVSLTANATINYYTVTIGRNNTSYGTVSKSSVSVAYGTTYSTSGSTLTFSDGQKVTATATSASCTTTTFSSWSSTSGTISAATTINANFSRSDIYYTVTISRNNTSYGTVSKSSLSVKCGTSYTISGSSITFSDGQTVTASVTAATGYTTTFSGWSPSTSGTITAAKTFTASFSRSINYYTVSIGRNNTSYGTVSKSSVSVAYGTTWSSSGSTLTFSDGQKVTASVTSASCTTTSFSSWSAASGTVNGAKSITANFSRSDIYYTVTINRNNSSYGTVSKSSLSVKCGTTYTASSSTLSFSDGQSVTASATAATGHTTTFSSWSSTSGTISAAKTITANFSRSVNSYTVTIGRNNTSYGTVSKSSVSIPYGTTYSVSGATLTFSNGTSVTASATAATGHTTTFSSWSSTSGTITGTKTITANFSRSVNSYTVTIGRNNTSYGTVSKSSVSIPYGTTYSVSGATLSFSNGTSVTASATGATGYNTSFSSWSSTSGTITGNTTINANFSRSAITYYVSYNCNGGSGTTTKTYTYGTSYTYLANPCSKTDYNFVNYNRASDGSSTSISPGASFSNLTTTHGATITLYAQWKLAYKNEWLTGKSGTLTFEPQRAKNWSSAQVLLPYNEKYNPYLNQNNVTITDFQMITTASSVGTVWLGGDNGQTKGVYLNGTLVSQMSYYHGDSNIYIGGANKAYSYNKLKTAPPWSTGNIAYKSSVPVVVDLWAAQINFNFWKEFQNVTVNVTLTNPRG